MQTLNQKNEKRRNEIMEFARMIEDRKASRDLMQHAEKIDARLPKEMQIFPHKS